MRSRFTFFRMGQRAGAGMGCQEMQSVGLGSNTLTNYELHNRNIFETTCPAKGGLASNLVHFSHRIDILYFHHPSIHTCSAHMPILSTHMKMWGVCQSCAKWCDAWCGGGNDELTDYEGNPGSQHQPTLSTTTQRPTKTLMQDARTAAGMCCTL